MAQAGLFNELIGVHRLVQSTNEYNEQIDTYEKSYDTRARILHRNGSRTNDGEEIYYAYTKTFIVRLYVPVSEFDRIKYDGKLYRILSIDKNKKLQQITIETELIKD